MLKKMFPFIKGYGLRSVLASLTVICEVLLEVYIPYLMADIINIGIANGDVDFILRRGLLMIGMACLSLTMGALSARFAVTASAGFAKNLRAGLFQRVQGFSFANVDHFSTASLITRLTTDVTNVQQSFMMIIRTLVRSPLMLIAAIGVKLSSPGPIIFKQERVGKDKKPFYMYKFRSMKVNSSQNTGWSKNEDNRKTWFGSLIRKCSVDELPQFFNVLKGDMSLIGPRPELPYFVEQFREEIPRYMVKHQVRPGITGWAQVNGYRGDTSISKRIEYDLYYIENWSPAFDLRILLMTVFCMFNKEKINSHRDKQESEEIR